MHDSVLSVKTEYIKLLGGVFGFWFLTIFYVKDEHVFWIL